MTLCGLEQSRLKRTLLSLETVLIALSCACNEAKESKNENSKMYLVIKNLFCF
jgi:hypothetical protein